MKHTTTTILQNFSGSRRRLSSLPTTDRLQSMFDSIREHLGLPKAIRINQQDIHRWKGTIGIIGLDPLAVSQLNLQLVEAANQLGLVDDQSIPEILAIGARSKNLDQLESQVDLSKAFGADMIIFSENVGTSNICNKLESRFDIPVHSVTNNPKQFAKEMIAESVKITSLRRPDILFHGDEKQMLENLSHDTRNRTKRCQKVLENGGFSILNHPFVGVLGGAGPYASAMLTQMLAQEGSPFVHVSANSAPGKHKFEIGEGPSYVPLYRSIYNFFHLIGAHRVTVPCNTAHMRLSEFVSEDGPPVVDIRKSVLDVNRNETGFILLGTNRTVGINCDGTPGLYEQLRENYPDQGPFYIPNSEQQSRIMDSIFEVKAGKFLQAKSTILNVIRELRNQYGKDLKVILGCTELPLVFSPVEIADFSLVDPSKDMSEVVTALLQREHVHRTESGEYRALTGDLDPQNLTTPASPIPVDAKNLLNEHTKTHTSNKQGRDK